MFFCCCGDITILAVLPSLIRQDNCFPKVYTASRNASTKTVIKGDYCCRRFYVSECVMVLDPCLSPVACRGVELGVVMGMFRRKTV